MGNILCFPKNRKKSESGTCKKQHGSSKKNRRGNKKQNDGKQGTFSPKEVKPSDKIDLQTRSSTDTNIYVCPVISSSILLRYDDEEECGSTELSRDQNEKKPGDQTNLTADIDTKTKATYNTLSEENIRNESTVVPSVEKSSEDITTSTPKCDRNEESVATVRVIKVQEVIGSPKLEPGDVGNNETLPKSVQKSLRDKEHSTTIGSFGLQEANKTSEPRTPSSYSSGKYSELQEGVCKLTDKETRIDSLSNKTIERKTKVINSDETETDPTVIKGEEKDKHLFFKEEKVRDEPFLNTTRELLKTTGSQGKIVSNSDISDSVVSRTEKKKIRSLTDIAEVETPTKEGVITGAISYSSVPEKRAAASHIKEFGALLNGLSALQTSEQKTDTGLIVPASCNNRHVFGPKYDSSEKYGVYKSKQGIEHWINKCNPGTSSPTINDSNTSVTSASAKKVSEFPVPWKPRKLPQKPLVLKKPSPHLYKIPGIAKSDSDEDKVNCTQVEPKGPQTEVLWTTKPSAFDVKLPPLPKRLLERKGSVEKLQESWIIPQVKPIETLKREHGRFPGLVIPTTLRHNYSMDLKKEPETADENGDSGLDDDDETSGEDIKQFKL